MTPGSVLMRQQMHQFIHGPGHLPRRRRRRRRLQLPRHCHHRAQLRLRPVLCLLPAPPVARFCECTGYPIEPDILTDGTCDNPRLLVFCRQNQQAGSYCNTSCCTAICALTAEPTGAPSTSTTAAALTTVENGCSDHSHCDSDSYCNGQDRCFACFLCSFFNDGRPGLSSCSERCSLPPTPSTPTTSGPLKLRR